MTKFTQKQLRALIEEGAAIDLTYGTNEDRNRIIREEDGYVHIGYAESAYGCGGLLLKGNKTGQLYAIPSRSMSIYVFG